MLKDYLEPNLYNLITKTFSFENINEIRLRVNQKLIVVIKNKKYFLRDEQGEYVVISKTIIDNFIRRITENSVYAYNNNIKDGFITLKNGVRVGLCGEVVVENNEVITIKNFNSLNIRIPHIIKNCSYSVFDYICDGNSFFNTLIISAPGSGKTTFLRDIIYQLKERGISKNLLVCDERSEIFINQIDCGAFCDIYSNCSKKFAFKNGIRSMRPDIILTDEIDIEKDLECLIEAVNSGVNVVATIHAQDIHQLKQKKGFDEILKNKFFTRFIVLTDIEGPGTLTHIFDEKLNCIYCR